MIIKQDGLWKGLLEELFPDFIRFVQPDANKIFDFNKKIEFMDKELEQVCSPENEKFTSRFVDKLAKVFTHDKEKEWVLFHVEVQAKYSKEFGSRMYTYFYRLLDKHNKPIAAYAIFTETSCRSRPDTYKIDFMGTKLNYQFNTYKIAAPSDEELYTDQNPFAIAILAARTISAGRHIKITRDRDLFVKDLKIKLIKHLLSRDIEANKKAVLLNFIIFYIRFELEEVRLIFENELNILTKNIKIMGLEEQILHMVREDGIEEGKKEGLREGKLKLKEDLLKNLIFKLGYTDKAAAEVIQVSVNFVKKLRKQTLLTPIS